MPAARRGEVATRTNPSVARRTPLSRERVLRVAFERTDTDLDDWLTDAAASGLRPFMALARRIRSDRAAVNAGLTLRWSTGPVEGHVTRVKLFKRQGHGRASTQLLRRQVVSAA